jgi:hypothetical protein
MDYRLKNVLQRIYEITLKMKRTTATDCTQRRSNGTSVPFNSVLSTVVLCVLGYLLGGCLPLPRAPVEGTVTTPAGAHPGIDFGGPPFPMEGKPVGSICTGTVVFASGDNSWNGGCGNMVSIQHDLGYKSDYCHLSRVDVFTGQQVGSGQIIGAVGNTGNSQGAHLHLQFWLNGVLQVDALNGGFPLGTTFTLGQLWGGGLNPPLNCP